MRTKGKGGRGKVVERGKALKNREKKKKKGSWGGGTTQHTKFIMFMINQLRNQINRNIHYTPLLLANYNPNKFRYLFSSVQLYCGYFSVGTNKSFILPPFDQHY